MAKTAANDSLDADRPGTRERLSDNPVGILIGGFAAGAVVGALLPTSSREREALQPVGARINDAARTAARNAADTGREKLNALTGQVVTQVGAKVVDAVSAATEDTKA